MPTMPTVGNRKGGKNDYEMMPSIKKVMDYGHLSYYEALELPCDIFMLMMKNSTIDTLEQTEEGRKYLSDCERLNTTSIDLGGLVNTFGEVKN